MPADGTGLQDGTMDILIATRASLNEPGEEMTA